MDASMAVSGAVLKTALMRVIHRGSPSRRARVVAHGLPAPQWAFRGPFLRAFGADPVGQNIQRQKPRDAEDQVKLFHAAEVGIPAGPFKMELG